MTARASPSRLTCLLAGAALLLLGSPPLGAEEAGALSRYFSPESVLAFADALEQEGDYLRAASELERYLSLAGPGTESPAIRYRIATLLRSGGQTERAVGLYLGIEERWPEDPLASGALLEAATTLVGVGEPARALELLDGAAGAAGPAQVSPLRGTQVRAVALMELKRWPEAGEALGPGDDLATTRLRALVERALSAPRRSPALAGFLSAVVPGTGKMYAGRALDGLYSLTSIGLLGTLSALAFADEGIRSVKGWIYASLGAVFYLGNVYGSATAARLYNERLEETLLHDARELAGALLPEQRVSP